MAIELSHECLNRDANKNTANTHEVAIFYFHRRAFSGIIQYSDAELLT